MRRTDTVDWNKYPNFSEDELKCSFTGLCYMHDEFMIVLQAIRTEYGKPMIISSGYRHPSHPVEAAKPKPGEHALGRAVDVLVQGEDAVLLLKIALSHRIERIGIAQKGMTRFIHLGFGGPNLPSPMIWSY